MKGSNRYKLPDYYEELKYILAKTCKKLDWNVVDCSIRDFEDYENEEDSAELYVFDENRPVNYKIPGGDYYLIRNNETHSQALVIYKRNGDVEIEDMIG